MQVFKVAREMGPSVIYLDEVEKVSTEASARYQISHSLPPRCRRLDSRIPHGLPEAPVAVHPCGPKQVFAMDKRRAEEVGDSESCSRIKRDLLQEIQALQPADRVVVIGCTNAPFSCTKKDSESLLAAFDKHFYIPLPDYAARQACPLSAMELPHDTWQPPASTKRTSAAPAALCLAGDPGEPRSCWDTPHASMRYQQECHPRLGDEGFT